MNVEIQVGQVVELNQKQYRFAEHPRAAGMLYGQEGRQATVYQLVNLADQTDRLALKVFKASFRKPALVALSKNLEPLAAHEGLEVCARVVLTPQKHLNLLKGLPDDFVYAVAMPWIDGPTWFDIVQSRQSVTRAQALEAARSLANLLAGLEQEGFAHCDISGPNVILPVLAGGTGVSLIDVEGFYGPGFNKPAVMLAPSPGYAQRNIPGDTWGPDADRFSGAILLAEILAWSDPAIRAKASQESFFDPDEIQTGCDRLQWLRHTLERSWSAKILSLVDRIWKANTLDECPTFGDWIIALANLSAEPVEEPDSQQNLMRTEVNELKIQVSTLVTLGDRFSSQGNNRGALEVYQEALRIARYDPNQAAVIERKIKENQAQLAETKKSQEIEPSLPDPVNPVSIIPTGPQPISQPGPEPAPQSDEISDIFKQAIQARRSERWLEAKELLEAVVSRNTDYQNDNQRAAVLLKEVIAKLNESVEPTLAQKKGEFPWPLALLLVLGFIFFMLSELTLISKGGFGIVLAILLMLTGIFFLIRVFIKK